VDRASDCGQSVPGLIPLDVAVDSAWELTSPYQAWGGGGGCATNADCRLPDWHVYEDTLVVECFNPYP